MANNTNTKRIEALEAEVKGINDKLDTLIALLNNGTAPKTTKGTATKTAKIDKTAKREAEKADFKANHKLVRSSKENKELVYAEMKKQGITEFNRKDYERIAKSLGVLGKSGKVVATWEEIK